MKISKILVASLASTYLTIPAMAEVTQPTMTAPSTEVVFNNHLDTADLSYAFGGNQDLQLQAMTSQEVDEAEGAVAPLVAVGVMAGGRFIVQRYVTQSVARSMVRSVGNNAFR